MTEVQELVDKFALIADRQIGPVEAVLLNAVLTLETIFKASDFDEETITAALLGSIAGGFPWVAREIGAREELATSVAWGHYTKAAPSTKQAKSQTEQRRDDSEQKHGADFALAIGLEDGMTRLALFQAKRQATKGSNKITISKSPRRDEQANKQLLALKTHAFNLMNSALHPNPGVKDLHWVHYLGYMLSGVRCIPLSTLAADELACIAVPSKRFYAIPVTEESPSFFDVLKCGMADTALVRDKKGRTTRKSPRGWLELTDQEAKDRLPHLRQLMPVYVAETRKGGGILSAHEIVVETILERKSLPKITSKFGAKPRP